MLEFARLPIQERQIFFQETANRRGLTRLIVEKDYWVCFALQLLFTAEELSGKLVFKGGTSLSKVFNIIERFSEDIDISLDPEWLGFGGENRPDAAGSRSQFDKRWSKLNDACINAVRDNIQLTLEKAITETIGRPIRHDTHLLFAIDEQTRSPILTFHYPTHEQDSHGYIHPQVKLELGSLTDQQPIGDHGVTPWVAEEFPNQFVQPECRVIALEAERTFWEKATILHAEHHRPKDKPMRHRLSRDCYDLCRMATHESGKRAVIDLSLLERVVQHKKAYFRSSWANYETAMPGGLRLVPPDYRLLDLKSDYQRMREMFITEPPPFDELLLQLKQIERKINAHKS